MESFHSILMVGFVSLVVECLQVLQVWTSMLFYDPHAFNLIPHMLVISKSNQGLVEFVWQPPKNIIKIRLPLPRDILKHTANISSNTTQNMWQCISVRVNTTHEMNTGLFLPVSPPCPLMFSGFAISHICCLVMKHLGKVCMVWEKY